MFLGCGDKLERTWKDYTLILPCVSVGNVGQLTADLVISTLCMSKAGYLYDDSILPVVGNDPFAQGDPTTMCELMTGAEVFESSKHQLVVVQLRSSIIPGKKEQFLKQLQKWIVTCRFSQVVILTSSFAHERVDTQIEGTQLRYVMSSHFTESTAAKHIHEKLGWQEFEKRPIHPAYRSSEGQNDTTADQSEQSSQDASALQEISDVFIPGSGFAIPLLQKCIGSGVPALILSRFCAEGDNNYDAMELANMLNSWLAWKDLNTTEPVGRQLGVWKVPSSWRLQYGTGFEQMLFQ